jgi:hypothetical protein
MYTSTKHMTSYKKKKPTLNAYANKTFLVEFFRSSQKCLLFLGLCSTHYEIFIFCLNYNMSYFKNFYNPSTYDMIVHGTQTYLNCLIDNGLS